ncbi:GcrA family cell cycle regulator [Plastoroseomonas hellenica]|uniref:GcrA family cell cycle regulator n=1 Tax=Plastoroseomonas hellenica TaxID=2687306 RepID=UPI001BA7385F|nr:GcrA family cell cycle regulator [Plastoroseomonas hellenica]MBR0644773.1 GcrA cell cycle regulator [Plastoroseomonas hellenica]
MDWNSESIDRLRALWAEGLSTAEIGRRMGISKNAVVGKAHRLNLPARPSPIRREAVPRVAVPRPAAPRIPLGREALPRETPRPAAPVIRRPAPMVAAAPAPMVTPQPTAVVRSFPRAGARTCCWPIGEPGTADFRFCTAESLGGKPYCAEHAALAYVKARDRREDAA